MICGGESERMRGRREVERVKERRMKVERVKERKTEIERVRERRAWCGGPGLRLLGGAFLMGQ